MKNKVQLFKPIFYILIGIVWLWLVLALARDVRLFYASASVLLLGISFALLKMLSINKELQYFLNQLGDQINSLQRDSMIQFPLPVLVSSPEGEILWFTYAAGRCWKIQTRLSARMYPRWWGKSITTLPAQKKGLTSATGTGRGSRSTPPSPRKSGAVWSPFILWTTTT